MTAKQISRALIVEEALLMLSDAGLEEVSLRKIAARLDVKAPSLYWHIADKDDLRAAMGERLLKDCLATIPVCADWQSWLRAFGQALFGVQMSVRDAHVLLMSARGQGHFIQTINQDILTMLGRYGVEENVANMMHWSVQALVNGWSSFGGAQNCDTSDAVPQAAALSLDVLIDGWDTRLSQEK